MNEHCFCEEISCIYRIMTVCLSVVHTKCVYNNCFGDGLMINDCYPDQLLPLSCLPWCHHLVVLCLLSQWGRASLKSLFQRQFLSMYWSEDTHFKEQLCFYCPKSFVSCTWVSDISNGNLWFLIKWNNDFYGIFVLLPNVVDVIYCRTDPLDGATHAVHHSHLTQHCQSPYHERRNTEREFRPAVPLHWPHLEQ